MKKVAVIPDIQYTDLIKNGFNESGYEVKCYGDKEFSSVIDELKDVEILIVALEKVSKEVMDRMPDIKVIGRLGVGLDSIDVGEATRRNIAVINVPDYCTEEVALQACSGILAANRKIAQCNMLVKENRWKEWREIVPIIPMSETTLGLIGLGRIGEKVVSFMRPFGCEILAYDPYNRSKTFLEGIKMTSLEEVLSKSDIITIHCPLNAETKNIVNKDTIKMMARKPAIINVSRGGIINETDLKESVDNGDISFAFLDVLEQEPPAKDHPLINHPKVFVTNHIGWYSEKSQEKLTELLIERIIDYLCGKEITTLVNREGLKK
jgi:D-3-phosphoglycerate dehydrogenase